MSGSILIHTSHMSPELLIAVLSLDRCARLPLLSADALQVPIAVLVQSLVRDEHRFNDPLPLPDGNHCQILDI